MAMKSMRFKRLRRRSKSSSAKITEEVTAVSTTENLNNAPEERGEVEETRGDENSPFARFFNGASFAISGAFSEVTSMAEDVGTIIAYDEDEATKVEEKAVAQTSNEVAAHDEKKGGLFSGVFHKAEDVGTITTYDEDDETIKREETSVTQTEDEENMKYTVLQSGGKVDEASEDYFSATTELSENDRALAKLNKELAKEEEKLRKIGDAYTQAEQDVIDTKKKISALYEKIKLEDLIDEEVVDKEENEVDYGRKIGDALKSGTDHVLTAAHQSGDRVLRFSSTMESAVTEAIFPHGV